MREVELPSGAVLKIAAAPWSDAKALWKAILQEFKQIKINSEVELMGVYKDVLCYGFSSDLVEQKLNACLARCLYQGKKIDKDTFEDVAARDDYFTICVEVAKENCLPFAKSLFAGYSQFLLVLKKDDQASRQTKETSS